MIRIKAQVTNPEVVDVTLTITLPVELWDRLLAVVECESNRTGAQPYYNLKNAIVAAVTKIRQNVTQPMDNL